jgi:hypothetical protein
LRLRRQCSNQEQELALNKILKHLHPYSMFLLQKIHNSKYRISIINECTLSKWLYNGIIIVIPVKYEVIITYTNSRMKCFLFQNPMQLFIQGQWWSMFRIHLLHEEQWWHLSGLNTLHIKQYLLLLISESPYRNPYSAKMIYHMITQNTGTCPGSVNIA